jgi:hypothetical protein
MSLIPLLKICGMTSFATSKAKTTSDGLPHSYVSVTQMMADLGETFSPITYRVEQVKMGPLKKTFQAEPGRL